MATFKSNSASSYLQLQAISNHRVNGGGNNNFTPLNALSDDNVPAHILTTTTVRPLVNEDHNTVVNDGHSFRYLNSQFAYQETEPEENLEEDTYGSWSCFEHCAARCDRYQTRNGKPFNLHANIICVVLIVYAVYVIATAHGVLALMQGFIGVIFGVEGLHNTYRYDLRGIRNFLWFLVAYCLYGTAVSLVTMNTIFFFCASAPSEEASARCKNEASLNELLHLLGTVIVVPVMWLVFIIYYRTVLRYYERTEKLKAKRKNHDYLLKR